MPGKGPSKKRYKRKKLLTILHDEEAGEIEDEVEGSWCGGRGVLLLAAAAGFSMASLLLLKPWAAPTEHMDMEGPPPETTPEPVAPARMVVQVLPAVPKMSREEREPGNLLHARVIWIHLHSYGGTTMCDLARAHKEKVSPQKDNCNLMPDACSTVPGLRINCHQRLERSYSFSAVERSLDPADLECPEMLMGIMLREPLAALKSTLVGNNFQKFKILEALRSKVAPKNTEFHYCLPPSDTFQHFDNFAVRSLGGAYEQPIGEVTAVHLERAKGVLNKLDVVLIMEDLAQHLAQLRSVFGWDLDLERTVWRSHAHRLPKQVFTAEEATFLKEVNHLDYQLFEHGRSVAQGLTARARQRLGL